jgi:aspartate aminotransferase-like enzyme
MLSHVSREFVEAFREALDLTKNLFLTEGKPFVLAGSGTLGMEATIANIVEPGDRALCVENGFFGEKFKDIVKAHGGEADQLTFEWGEPVDVGLVREKLEEKPYKALTVEHVDTSTGIANPIDRIGEAVKDYDTLYVVDTVCGVGAMPLKTDEWNIDVCLTGSQKAIAAPPGLTLLTFNENAWRAVEGRRTPVRSYYADLKRWLPVMEDPSKYFATPSVTLILALREALRIVMEEGLEKRWTRHRAIAEAVRHGVQSIGLENFPREDYRANTLTVPKTPQSIAEQELRKRMSERYKVIIAGGLGKLAGKTSRIGHMGCVTANDVVATLSALEMSLMSLGYPLEPGTAVGEAERRLVGQA